MQLHLQTRIPISLNQVKRMRCVLPDFLVFTHTQITDGLIFFLWLLKLRGAGLGALAQKVNTLSEETERGHWEPIYTIQPLKSKVNPDTKQAAEKVSKV